MDDHTQPTRRYHAPQRQAAAARRRAAIVQAAKATFEERGWSGTTMRLVAEGAGASLKTVEALFGTKAALLQASVDYAIRGDVEPVEMPHRETIRRIEAAPDAASMLELHAAHLRRIHERSARLAAVVEQAAGGDPAVAALWQRMNHNRGVGVRWATDTLLAKPGRRRGLRRADVEADFWVTLDWGTYRVLTDHAGLSPDGYERWIGRYYAAKLLAPDT